MPSPRGQGRTKIGCGLGVARLEIFYTPPIFYRPSRLSSLQGGEGDFAMRKVGPINGLKARVLEESPRLPLESSESQCHIGVVMNGGEPERDTGCGEAHALSADKTGLPEYGHGPNHGLLPTKEMNERLFIEPKL